MKWNFWKDSSKDTSMMENRHKHLSGCEGNSRELRSWSNLPVDVFNIIGRQLDFIKRVCKNSRKIQAVGPIFETLPVPWLMEHSWGFDGNVYSLCSFHLPIENQSHVTYNKIEGKELNDAVICASKFGWLLLQKSTLSFFYNPYTKTIIKLPDLDINFNRSTFSSVPTSPDCVCFAIQSSKNSSKMWLSTCQPGDRKWSSTVKFVGPKKAVEDVVYSNGTFYCVFSEGALGAFCVADSDWSLLTDVDLIPGEMFSSRAHMVESNGQLWLVCPSGSKCFKVFKFDWLEKTWDRTHALGCQALFLGCTSFSVSAEGETSGFAERIYYHRDTYSSYYSLETKQSYKCTFYPRVNKHGPERIWIQPPKI
ncbi:F-box protein At4g00893-like isoform X1 [Quercus robur]|uniref:F-box protein At4g00893-like isoform X1 n=1 Tax=Quercus robur TaxID=38942 RepID=UPI002163C205|nr:F-box protein At4g00893-like isoform X1 [Quercus robur]